MPTRQLVNDPTPTLANPGTVSLTQLKQILLDEIRSAAPSLSADIVDELVSGALAEAQSTGRISFNPTFPIWLNIPLSKSSAFFKPLSICETLAVGMAIITP